MIPSIIGLLVLGLGVILVYVGIHGGGFLRTQTYDQTLAALAAKGRVEGTTP